jgi:small multidrug resistance family-3 protein
MTVAKSVALFALAAIFETGGAWLVWQAARDVAGAIVRLLGVAVIMYGPPGH